MTEFNLADALQYYDIILIGDGSGVNTEGAWAVLVLDNIAKESRVLFGGVSKSTINVMELDGYIHALQELDKRGYTKKARPRVLIVSDSLVTVKCGNGEYVPRTNLAFWASLAEFKKTMHIDFKHINRDSLSENKLCDEIAGNVRKLFIAIGETVKESFPTFDSFIGEENV